VQPAIGADTVAIARDPVTFYDESLSATLQDNGAEDWHVSKALLYVVNEASTSGKNSQRANSKGRISRHWNLRSFHRAMDT
jgi:hypothetical protein